MLIIKFFLQFLNCLIFSAGINPQNIVIEYLSANSFNLFGNRKKRNQRKFLIVKSDREGFQ